VLLEESKSQMKITEQSKLGYGKLAVKYVVGGVVDKSL